MVSSSTFRGSSVEGVILIGSSTFRSSSVEGVPVRVLHLGVPV